MLAWYGMVKMAVLCLWSKLHSLYIVMKQKKIIQTGIELTFIETGKTEREQGAGRRNEDFGFVNVQFEMP